jgi:hypothetical protein
MGSMGIGLRLPTTAAADDSDAGTPRPRGRSGPSAAKIQRPADLTGAFRCGRRDV